MRILVTFFIVWLMGLYVLVPDSVIFAQQENQSQQGQNIQETNREFEWWWLLPLAFLPLVFLIGRGRDRNNRDIPEKSMSETQTGRESSNFEKNAMNRGIYSEVKKEDDENEV